MKHGSLFTGIGGFDLAAQWMGWDNIFQVEIDPWCRKLLKQNFPNTKQYGDIKEFKAEQGSVDILSGGFPCQPYSHAGKRKGEDDDRDLWPEYFRVIQEIHPFAVVGENVSGLTTMEDGRTLERIFLDLESEGYSVESFIIPAAGVGAWHRRDRIWIIAHAESKRLQRLRTGGQQKSQTHVGEVLPLRNSERRRESFWKAEPGMDRVVNGIPNRMDRVKGLGNAISPQVAYEIFKMIERL